ncbi:MAG: 2-oxoacid:acceptor oxidoreductase family protein [Planctomycetota bacterium]
MNPVVNDFSVRIATPNGTGSQTSNIVIHRALLRMGLAANAKNLFPSNIAGLPTWYQIRVSPGGWQTMAESWQILLPLNQATTSAKICGRVHRVPLSSTTAIGKPQKVPSRDLFAIRFPSTSWPGESTMPSFARD